MTTIRLFRSQEPVGLIGLDADGHRMRPAGILSDASLNELKRQLETGCISGFIDDYRWYRQVLPFCPLEETKPCPCDAEACPRDKIV